MLGVSKYERDHIDRCRARVAAQLAAYDKLDGPGKAAFEPVFFNNMVIVLDGYFMHRLRTMEGKDGNPMNEVRMLSNSLIANDGVFTAEKAIKLVPEKTVLKIEFGDRIAIDEDGFRRLADAYFTAIESTY